MQGNYSAIFGWGLAVCMVCATVACQQTPPPITSDSQILARIEAAQQEADRRIAEAEKLARECIENAELEASLLQKSSRDDAQQDAEALVMQAQREANALIAQAQAQGEAIVTAAQAQAIEYAKAHAEVVTTGDTTDTESTSALGHPLGIIGALEWARLNGRGPLLRARIDTGAETSSLDARNIIVFRRNGKRWVRFDVPDPSAPDKFVRHEFRVKRFVRIREGEGELDRRPVIVIPITLGTRTYLAQMSLCNRSDFDHAMLIGRNIINGEAIVDVSREFLLGEPKPDPIRQPEE